MWDLWWIKWHWDSEFFGFPISIIPPWFSMFMYLGDEQQAHYRLQFRESHPTDMNKRGQGCKWCHSKSRQLQ
jgi:hypothetical protein